MASHDSCDLRVELLDVDDLAGVLLLHIRGDRNVVVVGADLIVRHQLGDVFVVVARNKPVQDELLVLRHQLVLVADAPELLGAVDEQDRVVRFRLLQDNDAGGDGGAEEEVGRELDDGVDVVVVDKVLADLAFGAAAVQDAGEFDDRRRAVDREPRKHVHGESEVGFRARGEDAGGRVASVVDEQRVRVALPLDGVRRVRDDRLERLLVPVHGVGEGIAEGDVEAVEVDVVQEHVDPREVKRGQVDFLAEEALAHVVLAEDLRELEEERAGATRRVADRIRLDTRVRGA